MNKYPKVFHAVSCKGKPTVMLISDIVYIRDVPHIKLAPLNGSPFLTEPIDASKLHQVKSDTYEFSYEIPVEVPDNIYEKVDMLRRQQQKTDS